MRDASSRAARARFGEDARVLDLELVRVAHRVIRETTAWLARATVSVRTRSEAERRATFVVKSLRADAPSADDPHRVKFRPSDDERHPNYWRREYDVYASGMLEGLVAPLRAPIAYDAAIDARIATLWLEDVASQHAREWSDERFFAIARALGEWQGAFSKRAPDAPAWLARGSLRMWVPVAGGSAYAAAHREGAFSTARIRATLGTAFETRLRDAWRERDSTFAALDCEPHTIAHGDVWTSNVLAAHDAAGDVVVIDWSELGIAPLAHDLVNLVLDSTWMFGLAPERLGALEAAVLDGYAAGWRIGTGTDASATIARAYRANARLRFGLLAGPLVAQAADEEKRAALAARYERPFDDVFETRAAVIRAALA